MPCLRIKDGFVCGFHPTYEFEGYLFEWHSYCGPTPMTRKDPTEPRKNVPAGFWDAMDRFKELSEEERRAYLFDDGDG